MKGGSCYGDNINGNGKNAGELGCGRDGQYLNMVGRRELTSGHFVLERWWMYGVWEREAGCVRWARWMNAVDGCGERTGVLELGRQGCWLPLHGG